MIAGERGGAGYVFEEDLPAAMDVPWGGPRVAD